MRVTVLGCRGGYPAFGRACSGYLVEADDVRIWVDAGAGTLNELLYRWDPWELDAIWISHLHADHWTDLPIALHRMALTRPHGAAPIDVYGPPGWVDGTGVTARWRLQDADPVLVAHELTDGHRYEVGSVSLGAYLTDHAVETFGVRIEHASGVLGYTADSAPCEAVVKIGRDADLFLCEAAARTEDSPLHMSPAQAGQVARQAGPGLLVLTHLWPTTDGRQARAQAAAEFDGEVEVARQGRRLTTVERSGRWEPE